MTGYGRSEGAWRGGGVAVELKAVNHRYCEVACRLPRFLSSLEDSFRKKVLQRVRRGRVDVAVSVHGQRNGEKALTLDRSLAKQYYRALRELQKMLKVPGAIDVATIAGVRELISVTEYQKPADQQLERTVLGLLGKALTNLDAMRRREGEHLGRDIRRRLQSVESAISTIERRAPQVVVQYAARLQDRLQKLLGDYKADPDRLHQEFAFYADRCDVTEELTRLSSHIAQCHLALKSPEGGGKTLDFLLQEMGREINTIGNKSNDAEISIQVVKIKGELEKIREQVQNVE